MAKRQMEKILSYGDKSEIRVKGLGGILSRLFQTILIDLEVRNSKWSSLIYDYMNDPRNRMPKDRTTQTSRRGNLTKELGSADMTWKVFCKAMRVLQFVRIEIGIKAYHRHGGRVSVHTIGADFEHPQSEDSFNGDSKEMKQPKKLNQPLVGEDQ